MPLMSDDKTSKPGFYWRLYFGLLVLGTALVLVRGFSSPIESAWDVFNVLFLFGLWGYIRQVRIGWRPFWAIYYIYMACGGLVTLYYLAVSIINLEKALFNGLAIGSVLAAPIFVALWRYTFQSPHIWGAKSA